MVHGLYKNISALQQFILSAGRVIQRIGNWTLVYASWLDTDSLFPLHLLYYQ